MNRDVDVSCIFDDCSYLAISQENNGDLILETMEAEEHPAFYNAFTVFNPLGNQQHTALFYFFIQYFDEQPTTQDFDRHQVSAPKYAECDVKTLTNERFITLSFLFAQDGLIGIQSGTQRSPFPINSPRIWIAPPDDEITQNMKCAVLAL